MAAEERQRLSEKLQELSNNYDELKETIRARENRAANTERLLEKQRKAKEQDPSQPGPEEGEREKLLKERQFIQEDKAAAEEILKQRATLMEDLKRVERQIALQETKARAETEGKAKPFSEEFAKTTAEKLGGMISPIGSLFGEELYHPEDLVNLGAGSLKEEVRLEDLKQEQYTKEEVAAILRGVRKTAIVKEETSSPEVSAVSLTLAQALRDVMGVTTIPKSDKTEASKKVLSKLPEFSDAKDFFLHLEALNNFFALNELTADEDKKKLLLLMSLDEKSRIRVASVKPDQLPYSTMSYKMFAEEVQKSYLPESTRKVYQAAFNSREQLPAESPFDYLQNLFLSFQRGWARHSWEFFLEKAIQGLRNPHLRLEMWRRSEALSCDSALVQDMKPVFNQLTDFVSLGMDLVRKSHPASTQGMTLLIGGGSAAAPVTPGLREVLDQPEYEGGEFLAEVDDYEEDSSALTEDQKLACEGLETELLFELFNKDSPEEIAELQELRKTNPGAKLCFVCNSRFHLKAECPVRMQIARFRNNTFSQNFSQKRGTYYRGSRGRAGRAWRGGAWRGGRPSGGATGSRGGATLRMRSPPGPNYAAPIQSLQRAEEFLEELDF